MELITKKHLSEIQTRSKTSQKFIYDKFPTVRSAKEELRFELGPLIERPLALASYAWPTTQARFTSLGKLDLIQSALVLNANLVNTLKSYAFFRAHACVYVSITGTLVHQGILVAAVVPANVARSFVTTAAPLKINTLLSCPHAFLGANEATSACIEVPFYVPSDYLSLDLQTGADTLIDLSYPQSVNYATLILFVLNPLATGAGSSTTLNVMVQLEIKKFEVYGLQPGAPVFLTPPAADDLPSFVAESFVAPLVSKTLDSVATATKYVTSDFIDNIRGTIKAYTGLHNPNNTRVNGRMVMSGRNPANQVDTETYYEELDPNATYSRLTRDTIFHTDVDEMQLSHILSKPQYIGSASVSTSNTIGTVIFAGPISPYQGGCLAGKTIANNIELLSMCSRAWRGDIELLIQSSMTNKHSLKISVAKYYSPPAQILTKFPDLVTLRSLPNSLLEFSGGNQTLTVDLDFVSRNELVYMSPDKVANGYSVGVYYVYVHQPLVAASDVPTSIEFNLYIRCKSNFNLYGYSLYPMLVGGALVAESTGATVMNEPSVDTVLNENMTNLSDKVFEYERLIPNLDMRPYFRRMQFTQRLTAPLGAGDSYKIIIPIRDLVAQNNSILSVYPPNAFLSRMFLGMNGGVKVKLVVTAADAHISYVPPLYVNGDSGSVASGYGGFMLGNSVDSSSGATDIDVGRIHSGPFVEFPHGWVYNALPSKTRSVYDLHIPHNSIYNYWGNGEWNFGNPRRLISDLGSLIVEGFSTTGNPVAIYVFVGWDDETRFGFHTVAPVVDFLTAGAAPNNTLDYPLGFVNSSSVYTKIKLNPTAVFYYTNLPTSFT